MDISISSTTLEAFSSIIKSTRMLNLNTTLSGIIGLIGAGIGIAGGIIITDRKNKFDEGKWIKEKKHSFLKEKIHRLYAPIRFFAMQNEKIYEHYEKIHEGIKKVKLTEEGVDKSIEIGNKYINDVVVRKNNKSILKLLEHNSAYIDLDDYDIFIHFVIDQRRLEIEFDKSGKLVLPLTVYDKTEQVSPMHPEFIERVKAKTETKIETLYSLNFDNYSKEKKVPKQLT